MALGNLLGGLWNQQGHGGGGGMTADEINQYAQMMSSGMAPIDPAALQKMAAAVYKPPRYKRFTIEVEETSNGHIVRMGSFVRVCGIDEQLQQTIAAIIAEANMQDEQGTQP